ncbi:MAG TPA: ATP-binding protein [Chthoniobacterales bacterium]|jgi:signal transduction histidine kinase
MEFFALIPATAALVNLLLGGFVAMQGLRNKLNFVYCFWALALVVWNAGTALAFFARNEAEGLLAARFLQTGVIGLPFLLYHLSAIVSDRRAGKSLYLLYGLFAGFLMLNFGGYFVTDVRYVESLKAYYSIGGPAYLAFSIVCAVVSGLAVYMLHTSYRKSSPFLRRRIQTLLVSNYLIVLFGCNDIMPIIGVYTYLFTDVQILPLGSAAAIFYGLMVGYSVLQNQLLDVRLTLGRSMANLLRSLQVTLVGLAFLIFVSVAAPHGTFSTLSIFLFAAVLVSTGMVAALLFPRLFGSGTDRLEKMILGDYFEYQQRAAEFVNSLPWYTNFEELLEDLDVVLHKIIGVERFTILVLDGTNALTSLRSIPPSDESLTVPAASSHLLTLFKNHELEHVQVSKEETDQRTEVEEELRNLFHFPDAELCLPFRTDADPFGLMILSGKVSMDPFSQTDLKLLSRLVRNLSLVVNQMRLQAQIQAEQELDLLGRISKGLAHDLNNLLTPVATLLQVSVANPSGDEEIDSLVGTADRNVSIMRTYIRDSLFFSKTMRPQMVRGDIHEVIAASLSILQSRARDQGVQLRHVFEGQLFFVVDVVLFQRMVSNLISNAVDASSPGSTVEVQASCFQRREDEPDWLQLRVVDRGEGITSENLEKMKGAFFTTKDSGDGKRGFGLGLAICRKIVHLHGGTLNISSEIGKGTTVQVDLPNGSLPVLIAAGPEEDGLGR